MTWLNKTLIYEFNYDYIKSKYGNNYNLLFTDTDNLFYEVQANDSVYIWLNRVSGIIKHLTTFCCTCQVKRCVRLRRYGHA